MKYNVYIIFAFFRNVNRESEQKILYRHTLFVAALNDLDYYYYSERGNSRKDKQKQPYRHYAESHFILFGEIFGGSGEAEQKGGKKCAESAEYSF